MDIIVQTYIQTQREDSKQKMNENEKTLAWAGKSIQQWMEDQVLYEVSQNSIKWYLCYLYYNIHSEHNKSSE